MGKRKRDRQPASRTTVHDLDTLEIRSYISESDRGPQSWKNQDAETGCGLSRGVDPLKITPCTTGG